MFNDNFNFSLYDSQLHHLIDNENVRQEQNINLIASENYASMGVMKAQGSQLTNKYAEGYPGKRYYGGCDHIDDIENLAISRAKLLFGADYVNVQPHSGSQANAAVYFALLNMNDKVLAMSLNSGGHLTHGSSVNFSGKLFNFIHYELNPVTNDIDYNSVDYLANKHRPKMIVAGFSSFSGILDWQKFRNIADSINAYLLVDMAHISGLVAAGVYPNPIPFADVVTSTTHKTLRGPRGGLILAKSNPEIEKKLQSSVFPNVQGGPLVHVIAAKAVAFKEASTINFINYQKQVLKNAHVMSNTLISRGFDIVSNGTKNHLFLIDLTRKNITGKKAEEILESSNIIVNKNIIPNDLHSPFFTSGLRLGTPAITTRGLKENNCVNISNWIADILNDISNKDIVTTVKNKVTFLCNRFPIYYHKN